MRSARRPLHDLVVTHGRTVIQVLWLGLAFGSLVPAFVVFQAFAVVAGLSRWSAETLPATFLLEGLLILQIILGFAGANVPTSRRVPIAGFAMLIGYAALSFGLPAAADPWLVGSAGGLALVSLCSLWYTTLGQDIGAAP